MFTDTAASLDERVRYSEDYSDLPEGWQYLGAGISRIAFRGPDGLVYKTCGGDDWQSKHEALMAEKLRNDPTLPLWCYIPEVHYDERHAVVVTEFCGTEAPPKECYNGARENFWCCSMCDGSLSEWEAEHRIVKGEDGGCSTCGYKVCWYERAKSLRAWGVGDMHPDNVRIVPDGDECILVVIDLGCD